MEVLDDDWIVISKIVYFYPDPWGNDPISNLAAPRCLFQKLGTSPHSDVEGPSSI